MQVLISGSDGNVTANLVGETQIDNKPFALVDLGTGAYIKGVYTKLAVIPTHLIMDRKIDDVRVKD